MRSIKFSKDYHKLSGIDKSRPVKLLEVFLKDRENMSEEFVDYDTAQIDGGQYPLPPNKYMVLLFVQSGNLFTTVRRYTAEKAAYYFGMRGANMKIEIGDE